MIGLKSLAISFIRFYKVVSSYKRPCCRFIPSCSSYAIEAITKYGVFRGGFLAFKRILRCHPGTKFGYDPVP